MAGVIRFEINITHIYYYEQKCVIFEGVDRIRDRLFELEEKPWAEYESDKQIYIRENIIGVHIKDYTVGNKGL